MISDSNNPPLVLDDYEVHPPYHMMYLGDTYIVKQKFLRISFPSVFQAVNGQ